MKPKLIDVFPNWITSGIFSELNNYDVPWKNDNIPGLDVEYFGNVSGEKTISPLVQKLLNVDGTTTLSAERIEHLASIIYGLNGANWSKEYATLNLIYDPISNYDMTETETETGSGSDERHNTGTVSTAGTENGTSSATGGSDSDIYGFNTINAVGERETDTTSSATAQNTISNTRTDNLTATGETEHTNERTLTRSGNIGVTTSQQMIESERALYLWNYFYSVVFPAIDKVLTIPLYT